MASSSASNGTVFSTCLGGVIGGCASYYPARERSVLICGELAVSRICSGSRSETHRARWPDWFVQWSKRHVQWGHRDLLKQNRKLVQCPYAPRRGKKSGYLRPLNPIICCTTLSLCSATSPASRARSAQSSHSLRALPPTFTVINSSASFPQALQVATTRSIAALFQPSSARGKCRKI